MNILQTIYQLFFPAKTAAHKCSTKVVRYENSAEEQKVIKYELTVSFPWEIRKVIIQNGEGYVHHFQLWWDVIDRKYKHIADVRITQQNEDTELTVYFFSPACQCKWVMFFKLTEIDTSFPTSANSHPEIPVSASRTSPDARRAI